MESDGEKNSLEEAAYQQTKFKSKKVVLDTFLNMELNFVKYILLKERNSFIRTNLPVQLSCQDFSNAF